MIEGDYAGFRLSRCDDHIVLIQFTRPERLNGFTAASKRDFIEALTQIQFDAASRVLVITGDGRAFCAGDDFGTRYWESEEQWAKARSPRLEKTRRDPLGSYGSLRALSQAVGRSIRSLDKISIAAINGHAIQSGLSLALACDFRLATPDAKLGSATLRMGFLPDEGGHYFLVQHLGVSRTLDFLLRQRVLSGAEAFEAGLVHELADADNLMERSMAMAKELAAGPQVAMRLLKRAIYNAAELTFDQAGDDIASKTAISDHHPDAAEGARAWREKRSPRFNAD